MHVLTYHKAKGLEFGVVFLVGLVDDRFPGRERRDALELPDALVSGAGCPMPTSTWRRSAGSSTSG